MTSVWPDSCRLVIIFIIAIFIAVFEIIGVVRFARTGSMGEAFDFNAILVTIKKLGWGQDLIAIGILIIAGFIMEIIFNILMIIPVLGNHLYISHRTLRPFIARYMCILYDNADMT